MLPAAAQIRSFSTLPRRARGSTRKTNKAALHSISRAAQAAAVVDAEAAARVPGVAEAVVEMRARLLGCVNCWRRTAARQSEASDSIFIVVPLCVSVPLWFDRLCLRSNAKEDMGRRLHRRSSPPRQSRVRSNLLALSQPRAHRLRTRSRHQGS